uniref:Uncharacterized protein n=1 Tax=Ochrobactrum phage ORM_20 TaxID=2985243 RepID=A0A9N6WZW9_9VIRU|nr:hypothetical protein ORM20_00129 [Ochrobactrum phage ORM_20]
MEFGLLILVALIGVVIVLGILAYFILDFIIG